MTRKLFLIILAALFTHLVLGQSETYIVKKASFSSDRFDEFSPVYYKNGIVFCSNRYLGLSNRSTSQNKGLFKICYIDTTGKAGWESARLFSKNLTTILNDGPVSFNVSKDTIYYSRNQVVSGKMNDISGPRNKLGIYTAIFAGGQWTKVRELRINNQWYNVTTPCLSPDGKRLYFASDKPGGYGGSDLYYSILYNERWEDPVNLGPVINTKGNESYPFINPSGDLFFSSDGHGGPGGKDIFFSQFSDSTWKTPVCLDQPVNSKFDDFGFVTDDLMNEGFFSTNRDKSVDIYTFKTNAPQILYNEIQKENNYCFAFSDYGAITVDTANLKFIWNFGDGGKASGSQVNHCFKGSGNYTVKLDVVDRNRGNLFFPKLAYNLIVLDYQQPYINSPDGVAKGEVIRFDGSKTNLPGYKVLKYSWNFNDGVQETGSNINHIFKEKGEYLVNLELVVQSVLNSKVKKAGVSKKISVFDNSQEMLTFKAKDASFKNVAQNINMSDNNLVKILYSAENDFRSDAVFRVELLSSKKKLGVDNLIFRNVPKKYTIIEKYYPNDSTYSYIVDQEMTLMATLPACNELFGLGFKEVKTRIFVLKNPYEKELHNLIKIYGSYADSYFDKNEMLTSNAFIMLDQIVKLMNEYPSIKLDVAVHSDNIGDSGNTLALSQRRSQLLVNYLITRGIRSNRLVAKGYGDLKSIAPNSAESGRKLNRRIDFRIID